MYQRNSDQNDSSEIRMSRLRVARHLLFIPLVFICLGLLPAVRAVTPQPDGTYASFNVAEGFNAL